MLRLRAYRLNGILPTRHRPECTFPGKHRFYHSIFQSTNHQHSRFSRPIQSYLQRRMINLLQPSYQSSAHLTINEGTHLSLKIEYGSSIFSPIRRFRLEWGRWRWCLLFDRARREGRRIWWRGYDGTRSRRWEFLLVG
jgi:hypothetical protein